MTKKEMIATLAEKYPNFSKVTACMIAHPERYGLGLTQEAQQYLQEIYPEAEIEETGKSAKKKRKPPNRKKNKRIVLYVDDDLMMQVKDDVARAGFDSMQSYLTALVKYANLNR